MSTAAPALWLKAGADAFQVYDACRLLKNGALADGLTFVFEKPVGCWLQGRLARKQKLAGYPKKAMSFSRFE
jgi:hypothetical protein